MPVKRTAILCAIASILATPALSGQEVGLTPGPLEKRANPITPENPIPRRSLFVAPLYPAEAGAIEARAMVTLRVTLDESGRVAEIRRVNNPIVTAGAGAAPNPAALQAAGEALVRSAAIALQQWLYDAPANGPISFNVSFMFRADSEVTAMQNAGVPGAGLAGPTPSPGGLARAASDSWEAARGALRVGGNVRPPTQTRRVNPVYPQEARDARVQGVVILEALIGADGRVQDTRILRSIPLLDQAATDAVRRWEYEPVLLNGVPMPIVMTVTVQFTLSG